MPERDGLGEVLMTGKEIGEAIGEWVRAHRANDIELITHINFDYISKSEMICRVKFKCRGYPGDEVSPVACEQSNKIPPNPPRTDGEGDGG